MAIGRLLIALLFAAGLSEPAAARKIALVIGNGAYATTTPLPNPVPDARAIAGKLDGLGFEVISGYDQDLAGMQATVSEFARKAIGADLALLFYAGHGIQVHGDNFLVPIDAKLEHETALDFETLPVNFIMRQMSRGVRVRVIILDACRNNPLARSLARSMGPSRAVTVGDGLAEIEIEDPGEGTVIAFATSPGDVAYDGDSNHSPFAEALLTHIDTPDTPIQNVMTRVTRDVYLATDQRQRPWVNASLIGEVYLNETTPAAAGIASTGSGAPAAPAQPATSAPAADNPIAWDREKSLFESAEKGGAVEDYSAYLAAYPEGQFAEIARNFIARAESGAARAPAQVIAALPPPVDGADAPPAETLPGDREATIPVEETRPPPGTSADEAALGWDRAKQREVQVRLELAGQELGGIDGAFGERTRAGIGAWQQANGFEASGFFTADQFALLVTQTDEAYEQRRTEEAKAAREKQRRAAAATAPAKPSAAAKPKTSKKAPAASTKPRPPKRTALTRQRPPAPQDAAPPKPAVERAKPREDPCLSHPGHRVLWDGTCMY